MRKDDGKGGKIPLKGTQTRPGSPTTPVTRTQQRGRDRNLAGPPPPASYTCQQRCETSPEPPPVAVAEESFNQSSGGFFLGQKKESCSAGSGGRAGCTHRAAMHSPGRECMTPARERCAWLGGIGCAELSFVIIKTIIIPILIIIAIMLLL